MDKQKENKLSELLNDADAIVRSAIIKGAEFAEAVARTGSDLSVRVRNGKVELVEEATHRGIGLRIFKQNRVALTSTSDMTPRGIERFIEDAIDLLSISECDTFSGPADSSLFARPPYPALDLYDDTLGNCTADEAIRLATRTESSAMNFDPRIVSSNGASVSRTQSLFAMVLSNGFSGGYAGSYASIVMAPIVEDEGNKKRRGHYYSAKRHFSDLLSPEEIGIESAKRTLRKLGSKKIQTCEAPVVFDPDAAKGILGLFASCIGSSSIWKKSSYLVDRENTRVASPLVTILDDPFIPRGPGSRPFDGEGLMSKQNLVVENGILRSYLCDSYGARKLNRSSTSSASRSGNGNVGVGVSNFILQPQSQSNEEIIASTKKGLYVTEMMGFGFNAVTGDFSRGASGFWIENGKIAFPVSEVTISLNLDQLLKSIDAVGNDLDLRSSIASPTLRVSKMTISGN